MAPENVFKNLPALETRRLILRKMALEDAEDLFEYASDPEMTKFVIWEPHKSIEDSYNYLKAMIQRYEKGEVSEWGIIHKEKNKFIGTCGYLWWLVEHHRAEIVYALSRKFWNQGLMTEAIQEVIKFGFDKMALNRIEARVMPENIASQRVLKKVGMQYEGLLREVMMVKGTHRDLMIFSILRKEYDGKK